MIQNRSGLSCVRRLVIKIGSSLLADAHAGVQQARVERFADEIAELHAQGMVIVIVSSGAVALGCVHLGWVGRILSVHEKQAAAAIGQPVLMHAWKQAFARHAISVAQMLLTRDDLRNRRRYLNASNTSETLFSAGVIPIVNENDTVVAREIKFGDNDNLGALASLLIDADLLAILTDVEALFDADPSVNARARRLGLIEAVTSEVLATAGETGSAFGTGGMLSKLRAARIATRGGVATAILSGHEEGRLSALLRGEDVGTLFACGADRQSRRQHWIAEVLPISGRIIIDGGAEHAIVKCGASLLPVGMTVVEGTFDKGECVEIAGGSGVIARGLCNYHAEELRHMIGVASDRIEEVLGYRDFSSVVHRDNLVLISPPPPATRVSDDLHLPGCSKSGERSISVGENVKSVMRNLGKHAREASARMRMAETHVKNDVLGFAADVLRRECEEILAANTMDIRAARDNGVGDALLERLLLTPDRVETMAEGLEHIAALPDPVGAINDLVYRPSGIQVGRMRVPLGVIGMIYESRPDVTADAAGLCLKSGNAVILRGGSEAIHSNRVIAACLRRAMVVGGLPQNAVQLVDTVDRALVGEMIRADAFVDVIIPRGGRSLIERITAEARVPVIKHLDGICHVFVDAAADLKMALNIAVNAKTQRTGVCNAMETLLVHQAISDAFVPDVTAALRNKGVEIKGCEQTRTLVKNVKEASEADWATEYLAPVLSIRIVGDLDAAIAHIGQYGSAHTDSIVTEDYSAGRRFLREVDSASVMWNASTRFADGFEYGLGAEIGISTDRLHARGPVGLEGLTTQKWIVLGHGEVRE